MNAFVNEFQVNMQLLQGIPCIGVKIPKCVVKIEEQVFVFHERENRS